MRARTPGSAGAEDTLRRLPVLATVTLSLLLGPGCSGTSPTRTPSPPTGSPTRAAGEAFCRDLRRLDARLRVVRSYDDATASVERYRQGAVALDLAYRKMRASAPDDLDLAPMEYANGRFGEIVRGLPADPPGPRSR